MKFEIKFNLYIFLLFLLGAGNISAQQVSKAEALSIAMMFHKMLSGENEDISCSTSRRMNRRYMKHQVASSGTKGHDQNDVGNCCSIFFDIVNNIFRIYTLEQAFSIRLYSLSGQPVLQTTKTEIDVSSLPSGMYIVRAITVDGEQLQTKFIKQ